MPDEVNSSPRLNSPLVQLILARVREFYREPEAIFWVYGFPLILAIGLGLAFAGNEPEPPLVDVQETPSSSLASDVHKVLTDEKVKAEVHAAADCETRFQRGKTALYLAPEPGK